MQKDMATPANKQRSRRQRARRIFPDRRAERRAEPERRQGTGRRKSDKI